jgi:hypothetical protein
MTFFNPNELELLQKVLSVLIAVLTLAGIVANGVLSYRATRRRGAVKDIIKASNLSPDDKTNVLLNIRQWKITAVASLIVLCIVLAVSTSLLFVRPVGRVALSKYLANHDPELFRHSRDGFYDIARVLPDRRALESETDFKTTLHSTKLSFDLIVVHGLSLLETYNEDFEAVIKKGVTFRVLLMDPGPANDVNFTAFAKAIGEKPDMTRQKVLEGVRQIQTIQKLVTNDPKTFRGKIEVRFLSQPLLYSMWIKDAGSPDEELRMANVSLHSYRGNPNNSTFRVAKDGRRLVRSLADEFEVLWGAASATPSQAP